MGQDNDGEDDWDDGDSASDISDTEKPVVSTKLPRCGSGGCICTKKMDDPDIPKGWHWFISKGAAVMKRDLYDETDYRNPDLFGMYTYNDHAGYGVCEVIQNWVCSNSVHRNTSEI